jgi:hypothetical protein
MSEHTPAPWAVEQVEERADRPDRWAVVSKFYSDEEPGICGDYSKNWRLSEEDARLIAAAPDLLESLKAMAQALHMTQLLMKEQGTRELAKALVADARAAIAKAEGK